MDRPRKQWLIRALVVLVGIGAYFGIERWTEERNQPSRINVKARAGETAALHFYRPILHGASSEVVGTIPARLELVPELLPQGVELESHLVYFMGKSASGEVRLRIPRDAAGVVQFQVTAVADARRNYSQNTVVRTKPLAVQIDIQ